MRDAPHTPKPSATGVRNKTKSGTPAKVYGIGLVLLGTILAFLFIWSGGSMPHSGNARPDIAYEKIGPIRVSNSGYAMLTTLAVQTDSSNKSWVKKHDAEIRALLQHALADADVSRLQTAGGLAELQKQLTVTLNQALPSALIQQVLITDLIYQSQIDQ